MDGRHTLRYRFALAGWKTHFTPEASCVHVGGASHGGRLYRENLRGHLRFFLKHHGSNQAEQVRVLLRSSLTLRGRIVGGHQGGWAHDIVAMRHPQKIERQEMVLAGMNLDHRIRP